MNCRSLVELVTDYLEGALAQDERAAMDEHLAGCEDCTNYLEQMRTTIRIAGRLHEDEIPPEIRETLLQAFRSRDPA
ncbi:MAG: anti-sigma factor family protein [Actinomycetota bacterium]